LTNDLAGTVEVTSAGIGTAMGETGGPFSKKRTYERAGCPAGLSCSDRTTAARRGQDDAEMIRK